MRLSAHKTSADPLRGRPLGRPKYAQRCSDLVMERMAELSMLMMPVPPRLEVTVIDRPSISLP